MFMRIVKTNNYKILLVDDEQDILDILNYNLSKEGYNIVCLLYTSPSPRDGLLTRMPSSA